MSIETATNAERIAELEKQIYHLNQVQFLTEMVRRYRLAAGLPDSLPEAKLEWSYLPDQDPRIDAILEAARTMGMVPPPGFKLSPDDPRIDAILVVARSFQVISQEGSPGAAALPEGDLIPEEARCTECDGSKQWDYESWLTADCPRCYDTGIDPGYTKPAAVHHHLDNQGWDQANEMLGRLHKREAELRDLKDQIGDLADEFDADSASTEKLASNLEAAPQSIGEYYGEAKGKRLAADSLRRLVKGAAVNNDEETEVNS